MEQEINQEDYIPNEKYDKNVTDHDYDGIKELNNPSPNWVILIFMATFCFSMIYLVHYFGYPENGKDQASEYNTDMEAAKLEKENSASSGAGGNLSPEMAIAAGKKLYNEKGCIACHGQAGEGNAVGPNLTDKFWINGCSKEAIIKVITEGKPEKGMTPYKNVMTEAQIGHLAAFISGSLSGSTPANAKAAQGEECK